MKRVISFKILQEEEAIIPKANSKKKPELIYFVNCLCITKCKPTTIAAVTGPCIKPTSTSGTIAIKGPKIGYEI